MKKLLTILFVLVSLQNIASINIDSLLTVWEDPGKHDTIRLNAIHKVAWAGYVFSQPDSGFYYAELHYEFAKKLGMKDEMATAANTQGVSFALKGDYARAISYFLQNLKLSEEIGGKKGIATSLGNLGNVYMYQGDYTQALDYYIRGLKIREELNDKDGLSGAYEHIGNICSRQGDYGKAIEYYTMALKLREERGDKTGIGAILVNIGVIYQSQGNDVQAMDYYNRSLKIMEEIGNKQGATSALNNIGTIYKEQGDYAQALHYYYRSLKIDEELGDKQGIANVFNNLGVIYEEQAVAEQISPDKEELFKKAMEHHSKSLKIREEIGDKKGVSSSLCNIGSVYLNQEQYSKSVFYANQSLKLAQEVGVVIGIKAASKVLFKSYKELKQYEQALEMHELYVQIRDSIESEKATKEVMRQEFQYNYEKQEAVKEIEHQAELEKHAAISQKEGEKKNTIITAVSGGLGMLMLFSFFIYNRFRVTKKQKNIIERQKEIVDEKNKEISDSINYAKRIQEAVLPSRYSLIEHLHNGFVLFKPKDVVSGDFYWLEKYDNKIFFAAADCTGHGVPGAMVSVICSNALSKALLEEGITEPGKLLDRTRELVIQRFEKSGESVMDGMDISLCSLDFSKNTASEKVSLQWAGANNPLWIITKEASTELQIFQNIDSLYEIKADKQSIGKSHNPSSFTTHKIELQKDDTMYIFSDGFQDQFGGDKGKKFKSSNLKKLLINIQDESMEKQKQIIDETFENWKGNLEQVDDVCLIGVRL